MKLNQQTVGNIGIFYVCYRRSRHGWNVSLTARNARGWTSSYGKVITLRPNDFANPPDTALPNFSKLPTQGPVDSTERGT